MFGKIIPEMYSKVHAKKGKDLTCEIIWLQEKSISWMHNKSQLNSLIKGIIYILPFKSTYNFVGICELYHPNK